MKRKPSAVPLERGHITAALSLAAFIAVFWMVGEIVQSGFTIHLVYIVGGYFVVLAGGLAWANWHEENKLERDLRVWRRRYRPPARPKSRATFGN